MGTKLGWSLVVLGIRLGVLWSVTAAMVRAEDIHRPQDLGVEDAVRDIVISLPFEVRSDESIEPEGHQAWRGDVRTSAMMELRKFVSTGGACGADDAETCTVVELGHDADGRPTAVVEKDLPDGCWYFRRARATLHLFENQGEVWVTTKIVIREMPEPPKGR